MVFKVYRCNYLSTSNERAQMRSILYKLKSLYDGRESECIILIEPAIKVTGSVRDYYKKPDAIIIKDNVFCIIEMKGHSSLT